jgi:DNA polymerase III delta prime subunit
LQLAVAEVNERALVVTLSTLRKLVEEEHALEVDRAACALPLAFETATPVGEGNRAYRFAASTSQSGASRQPARTDSARTDSGGGMLRVGDGVEIVLPDGRAAGPFGVISALNGASVVVDFGRPVRDGLVPPQGTLRARADDNQRTIRLQAIERVVRDRHGLGWIGPVLTGSNPAPLVDTTWDPASAPGVTDGQRRALGGAIRSRDVFLIQGPPGTGKTTVITELLRYFAGERGARVLLASKSHRPIDNALDRLGPGELHVLRLGQAGKVTGAGQELRLADVVAQAEQDVPQRHLAARSELEHWLQSLSVAERLLTQLQALNDRIEASESVIQQHVAQPEAESAQAERRGGLRLVEAGAVGGGLVGALQRGAIDIELSGHRHRAGSPAAGGASVIGRFLSPLRRIVSRLHGSFTPFSAAGSPRAAGSPTAAGSPSAPGQARPPAAPGAEDRPPAAGGAEEGRVELRRVEVGREDGVTLHERSSEPRTPHQRLTSRAAEALASVAGRVCGLEAPPLSIATAAETRVSLIALRHVLGRANAALHELEAWGAAIERPGGVADVLVETAQVIAATAVGVNSGRDGARIADLDFDVAIVDEAGQAQLTDLIVPFSRARIVILVGDHQQLPPYLDTELLRRCADKSLDTAWLEKSVFEHLWDRLPESHRARLDVQFRMPEVIAAFLGSVFYASELQSATVKHGTPPVCGLFRSAVVLVDTSGAADRGETAVSPGFINHSEARLLAAIAACLPAQYRTGEGLGVIAPYTAQVTAARQAMASALGLAGGDASLVDNIATVDSFQGQERDVIIVSLTRSNAEGSVGFLSDLKRLNVTLSRARQQLVVIGDLSTLCASGGGQERQAFTQFMRDFVDHVGRHGEILQVAELRRRIELA